MKHPARGRSSAPLWLALLLALLALPLLAGPGAAPTTERDAVAQAWRLARESGSYDFQTVVDQQTLPEASLRGAGRRPRHDYLTLRGAVDQPAELLELALWRSRNPDPARATALKIERGLAMQRSGGGAWQPAELDTLSFAPGGDPMGFLAGASAIVAGPAERLELGGAARSYVPYRFTVDGPSFGRYLEQTVAPQLRAQGRLPSWMEADFSAAYRDLSGSGTLWVDQDGLPARLALDLRLPSQEGQGAVSATITSDFSGYDRQRLALATTEFGANPLGWLRYRLTRYQHQQDLALHALLVLAAVGLLALCRQSWRGRRFHALTVTLVIGSLLAAPLTRAGEASAFAASREEAAQQQARLVEQQAANDDALASLRQPGIDPHVGAVGDGDNAVGVVREPSLPGLTASTSTTTSASTDDADSDGDGLTDADEESWGSCPSASSSSEDCDGVADPTDSDADGIEDGVEVYGSGTMPATADSDNDAISDPLELAGFSYGGQQWYLDPSEADSNKDGLVDAVECPTLVDDDDAYDPAAACQDSDADGTPDVWDHDNDDDGVHDSMDLSTSSGGGTTYSADNPLALSIDSLTPDEPVFVDLQLLPADKTHLGFLGSVLDWPAGDEEGQITRRLSTTFADTENSEILSDDESAANGDLRLVPYLEITMPYQDGHYANLPVLDGVSATRTLGQEVDAWLDEDLLDPYGITVRDVDDAGELVAYVPLSAEEDETTGLRTSFSARMLYWPTQADGQGAVDWGAEHEYRVVWLVQLISEECADEDDLSTCADTLEIIHIYDESWYLTGLAVREDHGLDVAILYEDPDQDDDTAEEDDLWAASWNLNNIWLRGRDCDALVAGSCVSDGARDVTVATIESELDDWSGHTDAVEAVSFSYVHEGYLSHIAMTETVELLEEQFTGATTPVSETALLFAYEKTYRSMDLELATASGYSVAFDLDEGSAPELVQASMSWSRYLYDASAGWDNYDSEEDLERLALDLAEQEYFADDGSGETEAKIVWMQTYYSALLNGVSTMVEIDGELTWAESTDLDTITEDSYEPTWPSSTFSGAAYAADAIWTDLATSLGAGKIDIFADTYKYSLANPELTSNFSKSIKAFNIGSNILMGTIMLGVAVGLTLFAIGYLKGDSALLNMGVTVLNATTIVVKTAFAVNLLYGLYKASSGGLAGMAAYTSANWVGPAGLIFGIALTWGMFYLMNRGSFKDPDSFAFNMALAIAIATTIVQLLLYALNFIPIVGQLIVSLIYIVDAILAIACSKCTGVQTWMTQRFTEALYDVDTIITNLDASDRLDFVFEDVTLTDPDEGYTTANGVSYDMAITNTLRYHADYNIRSGLDGGQEDAMKTTVRYTLERTAADHHDDLGLGDMQDEWTGLNNTIFDLFSKYKGIQMSTTVSQEGGPVPFKQVGSGINRTLEGRLYLTESFAVPTQGCWLLLWNEVDCTLYPSNDSWSIDIGQYQVYDILPANLSDFYWLDWNDGGALSFPAQVDHDNDGLAAGSDPDDTSWDSDGDDLSDYFELLEGANPYQGDSDGDGLDDGWEIRMGSDPLSGDGDDDGLSDEEELEGWQVAYDVVDGTALTTWVWSDPDQADGDDDGLSDLEEFYYGLHPWAETDEEEILNTITFEDSTIAEQTAPLLLMRFEEDAGARVFADNSGAGLLAGCDDEAGACPSPGGLGRYGSAASYDGGDELDLETGVTSLNTGSFTIAAWVKTTGTNRAIVTKSDGDASWEKGEKSLYLDANGRPTFVGWGNGYVYSGSAVNDGSWHHVALTWTYGSGTSGSARMYVDGADVTTSATYAAKNADNAADTLHVGLANYGEAPGNLLGALDDLAVYDFALSQTQVKALLAGSYGADDDVVAPGGALDASLTLNNNSASWPAAVTYYGEVDDSFTGTTAITPYARWKFDEGASATSFADASGNGFSASCTSATCPIRNVTGYRNKAITMEDGDSVKLDSGLGGSGLTYAFAVGGWIYPTSTASRYQRLLTFLDYESTSSSAKLDDILYDSTDKQISAGYGLTSATGSVPLNTWTHVMFVWDLVSNVDMLYINGALAARGVVHPNGDFDLRGQLLRLGDPISGDTAVGFMGKVDDLALYSDTVLTAADVQLIMQEQSPSRPVEADSALYTVPALSSQDLSDSFTVPSGTASGSFEYTQAAEAALDIADEISFNATPLTRAHFDEKNYAQIFSTADLNYFTSMTCTACPDAVSDFAGQAVEFNGSDDVLSVPTGIATSAWSVGVWFKPTDASTSRAIFGNGGTGATSGFPSIFLRSDQKLGLGYYDGGSWIAYHPSGSTVRLSVWHQVTLTYNGTNKLSLYLDGQLYASTTITLSSLSSTLYLGKIGTGYSTFKGRLDNFTAYGVELSAAKVQQLASQQDLALHAHYSFDEPPGDSTFTDLAGLVGDASCSGSACPTLGTTGEVNRSALFDGADQVTTPNLPRFYRDRDTSFTMVGWMKLDRGEIMETKGIEQPFVAYNNRISGGVSSQSSNGHSFYEDAVTYDAPSPSAWAHIALTYDEDGNNDKLYINGVLTQGSTWADTDMTPSQDYPLWIGGEAAGYLDDIRFYARDLSESEVQALYASTTPVLQYEFEEDYHATTFADSSGRGYDGAISGAQSGNKGRVGNGATFDGASSVKLTGATEVDALSSNITLMAWVKPDAVSGSQTIFSTYSADSKGFVLSLVGDQLQLNARPSASVTSAGSISEDSWSHVAVVLSESGVVSFYIDGVFSSSSTLASSVTADGDGVAYVGAMPSGSGLGAYFGGKLDELYAYERALSAAEVKAAYYAQFRWFRQETSARVTVDADAPTISLVTDATYWPNDDLQLTVATTDTTSAIWAFDYTLKGPDGVTRTGQTAQPCADDDDNSLWCLTLDPASYGGAGQYTLQFRAVDAAGNVTTSGAYTLYVDGGAPTLASSYNNSWLTPVADADQELTWSVALSGSVSDPALAGGVAGAGVDAASLSVTLLDSSGATLAGGPAAATLSGSTWSAVYEISGQTPAGTFTVQVTAADAVGNSATTSVGTVIFDQQDPTVELTISGLSAGTEIASLTPADLPAASLETAPTTATLGLQAETTLRGVISEPPLPDGAVVAFHFAESAGATSFTGDPRSTLFDASCASCPSSTSGAFGTGLLFSAAAGTQLTVPTTDSLNTTIGTLSAWVRPTWTSGANGYSPSILAVAGPGGTRYSWQLADNYGAVQIWNGSTLGSVPATIARDAWTHLAVVQAGDSWTLYVNGVEAGSVAQAFGDATGLPLRIGSSNGSGGYFTGGLDEVMVFERALSAYEVYKLAQRNVAGLGSGAVEVSLLQLDLDDPLAGGPDDAGNSWQPAALGATGSGQTSWSYALPGGKEGLYEINVRGRDAAGNQGGGGTYWRGALDTWAPRATLEAYHRGGMLTGYTEFSYTFEDMFMDLDTLSHSQCGSADRSYTYDEDTGQPLRVEISCQVSGIKYGAYWATLCDLAGHCSTSSRNPTSKELSEAAIYSPAAGQVVEGTGALTIGGAAYADGSSVKQVVLSVDGSEIGSWSWAQNAFRQVSFEQAWTPGSPGSYQIDLAMTSWGGATFTDTATIRVISAPVPGGVRDGLALWLDPAEDVTASGGVTLTDGVSVAGWVDQAQGWTATNTSDQPPTYVDDALNFNPALTFGAGGASELSFGSSWLQAPPGSGGLTMFAVVDPESASTSQRMVLDAGRYATHGYGLGTGPTTALAYAPQSNSGGTADLLTGTLSNGAAPALLGYHVEFGSGSSLRANGALLSSGGNTQRTRLDTANVQHSASHTSTTGPLTLGRQANNVSPASYFQGQIAEVVAYTGTLSLAERRAVESYLALKYGLTLGDATSPISYTSSSGAVIWDAAQSDFQRDVAGIGLDEASGLVQRKSQGVAGSALLTIAHGALDAPTAFDADESFLLWGHDGGAATSFTSLARGTTSLERLGRTWQVRETGTVGAVELAFDLAGLSPAPTQLWLLVSATRDFSSVSLVGGTIVDGEARFALELADGQYLTFARNVSDVLALDLQGSGAGSVSSSPAGISCGADCQASFAYGATITLTATPASGSAFAGWAGACAGSGVCVVTLDGLETVVATFTLKPYALSILRSTGSGLGMVSSSPAGISCGADCAEELDYGSQVTLTASPHAGSTFVGWSGACAGTGASCTVTIDESNLVVALFSNPDGAPYGDVAWPIPGTIQAEHYNLGGEGVAYHDSDARQRGGGMRTAEGVDVLWPGDVDGSEAVGYTTAGEWLKYTVDVASSGMYELQLRVANPSADGLLSLELDGARLPVTIAVPSSGSHEVYTTGSSSSIPLTAGEHILTVLMERSPGNVNWLRFVRQQKLDITIDGSGSGGVAGAGISCPAVCAAGYATGASVTLTASPAQGSTFAGWSGACSGTASTCTVTLDAARSVSAVFSVSQQELRVTTVNAGAASGSVTSSAGISCGADCAEQLPYGTQVTLQASIANGTFAGWSGACSGQGDCTLTIDESNEVTASFIDMYELRVEQGGNGSGSVTSNLPGISCGGAGSKDCANFFGSGTLLTLTASAGAGSTFAGWGGACAGTASTCQVTLDQSRLVQASFDLNSYELSVAHAGGGSGTIISNGGISCGGPPSSGSCVEAALYGTQIWLTAQEQPGSSFGGWSGACAGSETSCLVRLTRDLQVSAHFYECNAIGVHNAGAGGRGSLRQAVEELCPGGTISFAGDYRIHLPDSLTIDKGMTIDGSGHSVILDGLSSSPENAGGILKIETASAVTLRHLTLANGLAKLGGAIYSTAPLTIADGTFTANRSTEKTGALGGGAIHNNGGALAIVDTTFSGNSAYGWGGAIYSKNGSLSLVRATLMGNASTNKMGGALALWGGGATIGASTLSGNSANYGGGILAFESTLTVVDSAFANNSALYYGGGLSVDNATGTIVGTSLTSNSAGTGGGGLSGFSSTLTVDESAFAGNSAPLGGGLYPCDGTATISRSSITRNTSKKLNDLGSSGGGVYACGSLTISDSTLAGNTTDSLGGGLYVAWGETTLLNSTISGNRAKAGGGGGLAVSRQEGTLQVRNSIVANSLAGGDCAGPLSTNTNNLVEDGSCSPARSGDPLLGALGSYGELTEVVPPLPGSVAIDAGNAATCTAADQRGDGRVGARCDLGARESQGFKLLITGGDGQRALPGTAFTAPLALQLVANATGEPVRAGLVVRFTAPSSGASLSSASFTATTSATGQASASVKANGVYGSYQVKAVVAGLTSPISFSLRNAPEPNRLSVSLQGEGLGTVGSSPAGIACGSACSALFDVDATVTLTATPSAGSSFGGWGGACAGTGACQVTLDQARSVTASFALDATALRVTVYGAGSVASTPSGIACSRDCVAVFAPDELVTLTASASGGARFGSWGGACAGTSGATCQVTMSQARSVSATFLRGSILLPQVDG